MSVKADEWLRELRVEFTAATIALMKDLEAGRDGKNPAFNTLVMLKDHLGRIDGFEDCLAPLTFLIEGAIDLDRGHTPRVFAPKKNKKGGAPRKRVADDHVRAFAVAAVAIAMRGGMQENKARELVANAFSKVKGMVNANGLKNWRSRATGPHAEDEICRDRVENIVNQYCPDASLVTAEHARTIVKRLGTACAQRLST